VGAPIGADSASAGSTQVVQLGGHQWLASLPKQRAPLDATITTRLAQCTRPRIACARVSASWARPMAEMCVSDREMAPDAPAVVELGPVRLFEEEPTR